MRIKYLPLLLLVCVSLQSIACSQTDKKSPSTETKPIEIPSGVKEADYEANPDDSLLLTLNSDKQLYYQDKLINDSTLKDILKDLVPKTKKLPAKSAMPSYLLDDDKVNRFYLRADAGLPFSEVIKLLKTVQESSPNEYRVKFIVNPAEEVGKAIQTPNGKSVISIDLGAPAPKTDIVPRPNPLMLVAKLDAAGKIKLNNEPTELSDLKERLTKIYNDRERYGVFVEGTNEIEKTIILVTALDVKYGDVIKFIDELYGIYARPIKFGDLRSDMEPSRVERKTSFGQGQGSGQGEGFGRGDGAGVGRGTNSNAPPPPKVKKP